MLALNASPSGAFVSAIPVRISPFLHFRCLPFAHRRSVPPKPPRRLTFLTPPTARQPSTSPPSFPIRRPSSPTLSFSASRRLIFIGMSGMYALYVVLRGTFTYIAPVLAKSLSLSISQLGLISSAFPLLYGFSRLLTGVLADRTSPSRALGAGLLMAGLVNIAMSTASSPALLASLWGLNGLVQGVGAGASAKILTSWHSRTERGKAWSLWSSSANLGAFIAPIFCGWLATTPFGYRAGLLVPGALAAIYALLITPNLHDSPVEAGHTAPWDADAAPDSPVQPSSDSSVGKPDRVSHPDRGFRQVLVQDVLLNWRVWALAFSYYFVYFTRSGLRNWLQFALVDGGLSPATAAYRVSGMEIGGVLGTFSAGYASDYLDGRRVLVAVVFFLGLGLSLAAAACLPPGAGVFAHLAVISAIGFFINGPQCLLGLVGAEVANARVVATVSGVLGWVSYLGATTAGLPLSWIVKTHGWSVYYGAMIVSTVTATLLLLPMIGLKGSAPPKGEALKTKTS